MPRNKSITKTDLINALKAVGIATKKDVQYIVGQEIDKRNFATKDDLKNFATKKDLGNLATKDDLGNFATKDDLKNFATKDDLSKQISSSERKLSLKMNKMEKRLISAIAALAETTPTRKEFEELKHRLFLS